MREDGSARALCTAFDAGSLTRDQFWSEMRDRHRLLEEYTELVGRGDLRAIEIHPEGLCVVFRDGLRMYWHPEDTRSVPSVSVNHGSYEPEETRALVALAEEARIVLDIGANAGFMALKMARAQRRAFAKVHAFEPVLQTHAELTRNLKLNGLTDRVSAHAFGLGEAPGNFKFYVPAFHGSVAASARALFASDENREVSVELSTLDRFAAEQSLSEIDLIKCDVEGAELFVIRGGLRTLEATRPVLMLEMLRKWAKVYDYHPNDILALLIPLGYRCFSLSEAGLLEHARIEDETQATNFFLLDPVRHAAPLAKLIASFGERPNSGALEISDASIPESASRASMSRLERSRKLALRVRRHALEMVHRARASHIGSCLSIADILAVLYGCVLRVEPNEPESPSRDRFILSKGHAAAALYAVLAESGFFPCEWLSSYSADGSPLAGHVVHKGVPGVEVSTGSLGHGLSIGVGMALAASRGNRSYRTFVLLSDGECDEGAVWEAALFASQHRLDKLVAIVDKNELQGFGRVSDVLGLEPFADKWRAFGWNVIELSGHDHAALDSALSNVPTEPGKPTLVIARTMKGKGVSFMEDQFLWHYRSPDAGELARALAELESAEAAP